MTDKPTLPSLAQTLKDYGLFPKKSMGQNFILQPSLLAKMVTHAGDLRGKPVVEVGAGPGGLTRALLEAPCLSVTVIEKDDRCIPALQELQSYFPDRLHVIHGDALTMDWERLAPTPYVLVGNLPYRISVPLLLQWLETLPCFSLLLLMFQAEVVQRLTAVSGTKVYGRLSILTQWCCQAKAVLKVPAKVFTPPPKVASTVVRLIPKQAIEDYPDLKPYLESVTGAAFQQRRKMLRSSLKGIFKEPTVRLESMGIDPTLRAEDLDLNAFLKLARLLKNLSV